MNDIEKARAYDEALERAKKQRADYQKELDKTDKNSQLAGLLRAGISAIDMAFPELKESEDEGIRKEIVSVIQKHYPNTPESYRWISWLEKQKEHQLYSDAPKEKSVGGDFYSSHKDKNLDEIAQEYVDGVKEYNSEPTWDLMQTAVCYGANWQKEQFEKNRLANCDALSKEECDRETDFAMEIIEKEHRQPTFNDAINYGMRLQKSADLPAGFYVTLPDGKKYYAKEMRCNGMNVKVVEPKPAEVCYGPKGDPDPAGVWKPCEEQLNALLYAMSFVSPATKESVLLSEIYENLKKL